MLKVFPKAFLKKAKNIYNILYILYDKGLCSVSRVVVMSTGNFFRIFFSLHIFMSLPQVVEIGQTFMIFIYNIYIHTYIWGHLELAVVEWVWPNGHLAKILWLLIKWWLLYKNASNLVNKYLADCYANLCCKTIWTTHFIFVF